MTETTQPKPPPKFPLTPRQIRLRYSTYLVLAIIVAMIVFGLLHPAFRMKPPAVLTDSLHPLSAPELKVVRKAFAVKLLFIGLYWATTVVLTLLLPIFAWLYTREIQVQELIARRDLWREVSGRKDREPPQEDDSPDADKKE